MRTYFEESNLLNSPYEAFLFRSDNGYYPVNSHWHYFCEMLYIINGDATIHANEDIFNVHSGDFVFFHPQVLHSILGETDVQFYVIKFDLSLLKSTSSHMPGFQKVFFNSLGNKNAPIVLSQENFKDYSVPKVFETCIKEITDKNYGYDLCIQAEITSLLTQVLRIWRNYGFEIDTHPATSTALINLTTNNYNLTTIAEYIDANLSSVLRAETLAEMCNMSYSYFAKQFLKIYGRSCKEYISYMRINRVKDLLLFTNKDLSSIALETGFADCSHMIRTFKKIENTTPKQFRMQQGVFS